MCLTLNSVNYMSYTVIRYDICIYVHPKADGWTAYCTELKTEKNNEEKLNKNPSCSEQTV